MFKQLNGYDDSYNISSNYSTKSKVNYFNIMVVGESHSGEFNFIEFIYKHCFNKEFVIDKEELSFRDFSHRVTNGRRSTRVINIVHSKGYKEDTNMKEWLKSI